VRILIADDSGLLRACLAGLLAKAHHDVVGAAADADEVRAPLTDDHRLIGAPTFRVAT